MNDNTKFHIYAKAISIVIALGALLVAGYGLYLEYLMPEKKEVYIEIAGYFTRHDNLAKGREVNRDVKNLYTVMGNVSARVSNTGDIPIVITQAVAKFTWGRRPNNSHPGAETSNSVKCYSEPVNIPPGEFRMIETECNRTFNSLPSPFILNGFQFLYEAKDPFTGEISSVGFYKKIEKEIDSIGTSGGTNINARMINWSKMRKNSHITIDLTEK